MVNKLARSAVCHRVRGLAQTFCGDIGISLPGIMFGEKRKFDVLQDPSNAMCMTENGVADDRPEQNVAATGTNISCECMNQLTGSQTQCQKRVCLTTDGERMGTRLPETRPQSDALWTRVGPAGDSSNGHLEVSTAMEVDLPVTNRHTSTYPHTHGAECLDPTEIRNLDPFIPKRCQRCASGEPGHIKHILS